MCRITKYIITANLTGLINKEQEQRKEQVFVSNTPGFRLLLIPLFKNQLGLKLKAQFNNSFFYVVNIKRTDDQIKNNMKYCCSKVLE